MKQAVHPLATLIGGFGSARGVLGGAVNTVGGAVGGAVNTAGRFVVKQTPKAFPTALAYGAAGAGKCSRNRVKNVGVLTNQESHLTSSNVLRVPEGVMGSLPTTFPEP